MFLWSDWGRVIHLFVTVFLPNFNAYMVTPVIRHVVVEAVCGAKDECSLALYLTGFQQAIRSHVDDACAGKSIRCLWEKKVLLFPLVLSILPLGILAWERTKSFFYTYYVFKILTGMVTEGGVVCLALAYLEDNVNEGRRVSGFGILSGVVCAANLSGTFAARFLSTGHIFQVLAGIAVAAVAYATVLLKEVSYCDDSNSLVQKILNPAEGLTQRNRGL